MELHVIFFFFCCPYSVQSNVEINERWNREGGRESDREHDHLISRSILGSNITEIGGWCTVLSFINGFSACEKMSLFLWLINSHICEMWLGLGQQNPVFLKFFFVWHYFSPLVRLHFAIAYSLSIANFWKKKGFCLFYFRAREQNSTDNYTTVVLWRKRARMNVCRWVAYKAFYVILFKQQIGFQLHFKPLAITSHLHHLFDTATH